MNRLILAALLFASMARAQLAIVPARTVEETHSRHRAARGVSAPDFAGCEVRPVLNRAFSEVCQ